MTERVRFVTQKKDRPRPEGVNYFTFTQVGTDVQMLAGYVDLDAMRGGILSEEDYAEVPIAITNRFSMSITSFFRLHDQADDLIAKMRDAERSCRELGL